MAHVTVLAQVTGTRWQYTTRKHGSRLHDRKSTSSESFKVQEEFQNF